MNAAALCATRLPKSSSHVVKLHFVCKFGFLLRLVKDKLHSCCGNMFIFFFRNKDKIFEIIHSGFFCSFTFKWHKKNRYWKWHFCPKSSHPPLYKYKYEYTKQILMHPDSLIQAAVFVIFCCVVVRCVSCELQCSTCRPATAVVSSICNLCPVLFAGFSSCSVGVSALRLWNSKSIRRCCLCTSCLAKLFVNTLQISLL